MNTSEELNKPLSTKRRYGVMAFILVILGGAICMGLFGGVVLGYLTSQYSPLRWMDESWSDKGIAITQRRGDVLIAAIERYRAQHGDLPKTLDALVPDQLGEVLSPVVGDRQWHYGRLMNYPSDYYLSVDSRHINQSHYNGIESLHYNSFDQRWDTEKEESLLY